MRPLHIRMSAFGPYAGVTEIAMEDLGTQGLYLITGDTGSGKTTIFDAICYALYGEASGTNRDATMLRSKYAEPQTPTEVELTFSHGGKVYKVRRNPEYLRPAKRGDGFTKQAADAELVLPDGGVVTRSKTVNEKIREVLGIDRDQFSRIVMLAQGDFYKVLTATTEERIAIFRKIFKTGYFEKLQKSLDEEQKTLFAKIRDGKKSVEQYVAGIAVDADDVLSIDVEQAKSGDMLLEDVMALLEKLIEQDCEGKKKIDAELCAIKEDLSRVGVAIGAANTVENAKKARKELADQCEEEEKKAPALTERLELARKELKAKAAFEKEANVIENELPRYDEVERLKVTVVTSRKNNEKMRDDLEKKTTERETTLAELEEARKEGGKYKDSGAELVRLGHEIDEVKKDVAAMEELRQFLQEYTQEKARLKKAQEAYTAAADAAEDAERAYAKKKRAFMDGQAGILARDLKEGEPCPVCGSLSHPKPAPLSEEVPTQDELDAAEAAYKEAESLRNARFEKASKEKATVEAQEEQLGNVSRKLLGTADLDEVGGLADEAGRRLNEKMEGAKKALDAEAAKVRRKEELERLVPKIEQKINTLGPEIETLNGALSAGGAALEKEEQQLASLQGTLKYKDKETADAKRRELLAQGEKLQKAFDLAQEAFTSHEKTLERLRAGMEQNDKAIAEADVQDLEALKEEKASLDKRHADCVENGETVAGRLKNNTGILENVKQGAEGISTLEKRMQWVKALDDTANGKLSGKDKVKLETYVQMTYFDRIIRRANMRLTIMTGGKYELVRQREASNGKSQSGLDLGVIDHYNGSERSVKSLSGGEIFVASLSLALGLSDEVQSSAGGIMIDTMFVDEGFGTLDSEILEMSYKALSGLTEGHRLVGIISHVDELKERIDKQIVVTKEKSGGSSVRMVL